MLPGTSCAVVVMVLCGRIASAVGDVGGALFMLSHTIGTFFSTSRTCTHVVAVPLHYVLVHF